MFIYSRSYITVYTIAQTPTPPPPPPPPPRGQKTDLDRGRRRQEDVKLSREVWVEDVVVLLTKTYLDEFLGRKENVEYYIL